VKAVVDFFGAIRENDAAVERANPITNVLREVPPFFVMYEITM